METLEGRLAAFRASIEYVTKSLEVDRLSDEETLRSVTSISEVLNSNWISRVADTTGSPTSTCITMEQRFKLKMFAKQLEEVAISLWNVTVGKQTLGSIKDTTAAVLRQICYDLIVCPLCLPGDVNDPANNPYMHRRIMMAAKVGKTWLDLEEFGKSSNLLICAKTDIDTLMTSIKASADDKKQDITSLNKQLIRVYCDMAIAASGAKDHTRAFEVLTSAANMDLSSEEGVYDREFDRVSATAYNLGLAATNERKLDTAIKWLALSFEAGKRKVKTEKKNMALTLRLLAHVYSETGEKENLEKSLNAVDLAHSYHAHPAGIHLRLKIMSKNRDLPDCDVRKVLEELLRHSDLEMEVGLNACAILNTNGRYELCDQGLKELLSRFNGSRQVGKIHVQQLQAAVQRLPPQDALDYTQTFLTDSKIADSLDSDAEKNIQLLLWEQAAKSNEAGEFDQCLSWYDHSLLLFKRGRSIEEVRKDRERSGNLGRLQRNRTSCLLNRGRLVEAEEAAKISVDMDSENPFSMFCLFKVKLYQGQEKEAIDVIERLTATTSGKEHLHELICLAAQLAFEKNHRSVAMVTLRHLATSGTDDIARLTAYRCLIRLHLAAAEEARTPKLEENLNSHDEPEKSSPIHEGGDEKMEFEKSSDTTRKDFIEGAVKNLDSAFKLLEKMREKLDSSDDVMKTDSDVITLPGNPREGLGLEQFTTEVTWFMKIAWNMALQAKDDAHRMKRLYLLCKNLLCLTEPDECALLRQITCLLMCAACGLTIARVNDSIEAIVTELEEVLSTLIDCRAVCEHLAVIHGTQFPQSDDKSAVLLLLYHFEALAKIISVKRGDARSQDLDQIFDELHSLPLADAKTFETIAGLAVEHPAHHTELCKRGLKVAIGKIEKSIATMETDSEKEEALKKQSSLYRMLIDTCLKQGSGSDPTNKEESWQLMNEAYLLVTKHGKKYPETEVVWLTTRAWNVGVNLFVADHVVEAEHWCAFALRVVGQLDVYKESYEKRMNNIYQEIIEKKDLVLSRRMKRTVV
ncbi:testis-expressed protein 11-like isoform X2 [Ciona intestinalis]